MAAWHCGSAVLELVVVKRGHYVFLPERIGWREDSSHRRARRWKTQARTGAGIRVGGREAADRVPEQSWASGCVRLARLPHRASVTLVWHLFASRQSVRSRFYRTLSIVCVPTRPRASHTSAARSSPSEHTASPATTQAPSSPLQYTHWFQSLSVNNEHAASPASLVANRTPRSLRAVVM